MIEFKDVRFTYDGTNWAINGVTTSIQPGEFVCILGGNGSGKSTLAKHINALLIPDEGEVRVGEWNTADEDARYLIRSTAGMVFQNPDDQLVATLVENDVAFGPENLGVPTDELRERITASLKAVGLSGFEKAETTALSGGQKQRVAIAGVLAMKPRVLILDEASAMIDPRGRTGLMRIVRGLNSKGFTIIMITHFMEEAAAAQRILVMEAGRICMEGTPNEVLKRADELRHLHLDVPFSVRFSLACQDAGLPVTTTLDAQTLEDELCNLLFDQVSFTYDASLARTEKKQAKKAAKQRSAVSKVRTEAAISPNDAATEAASLAASAGVANADEAASATHVAGATPSPTAYADWGNNPDNQWALQNISFTVNEGDFLGIAGHTGSGKSTLLQHMNGLLEPTRGRITLDGADLADKAARKSCRNAVGVVFQYPERQLFASTVYDDVAFGPRNLKLDDIEVDRRVRASLESVGLSCDDLGNASPFELSGGQQRRVAFAGVLAMNPQVLVLDEPTAGLDPEAKAMFLQLIDTLHKDGMTVVMVSHNMDDLARFCNRIIVLNQGQIVLEGTPEQVFSHEGELHAIGLDIPTAQRMANNLRAHGVRLPARLFFDAQDLANACAALYKQGLQADKAQNMQGAASQNATGAAKAPDSGAQPSAQTTSQPNAQISATQQEAAQS